MSTATKNQLATKQRGIVVPARTTTGDPSFFLVAPAAFYLLLTVLGPLLLLIWFAVTDTKIGVNQPVHFVGLSNFNKLFRDDALTTVITNTIRYASISTLSSLLIGFSIALLLRAAGTWQRVYQLLFTLPWAVPSSVVALIWLWMFYDVGGVFNWLLLKSHLASSSVSWLGDARLAQAAVLFPNIWRLTPFFILSLLASLKSIDMRLYEAAKMDGATSSQQFRYITLPLLMRTILVTCLFGMLWSMTEFSLIFVLTQGGPGNTTHLIGTLAYDIAFRGGADLSLGAACALILIPLSTISALLIWRLGSWREA